MLRASAYRKVGTYGPPYVAQSILFIQPATAFATPSIVLSFYHYYYKILMVLPLSGTLIRVNMRNRAVSGQ